MSETFWHWQNLSAERYAGRKRTIVEALPIHGRAWLRHESGYSFRVEWNFGSSTCGARLSFTPHDEDTLSGMAALPPIALYWGLEAPFRGWLRRVVDRLAGGKSDVSDKYGARELSVNIQDWAVWWDLWVDPGGWSSKRPRWRDGSFHALDWLLGKRVHKSVVLDEGEIVVPMPEGVYRGHCKLSEDTWKRPRWFVTKRVRRAHIDMTEPVPFPGKGENSWDCGEDALHGSTTQARTFGDAIGSVVASVMNSRLRHGGKDWRPARKAEAAE